MEKKKTKDDIIRLRINKKDKERLAKKAKNMNMTLSTYVTRALELYSTANTNDNPGGGDI